MNGGLVIEKEFDGEQSICSTQKNATGTKLKCSSCKHHQSSRYSPNSLDSKPTQKLISTLVILQ